MALTRSDFEYVCRVVRQRSAISLDEGKEYLAETRLNSLAQREGISSATDLVKRLRVDQGHELYRKVVEAMTTNETSFFRDLHPLEQLRKVLIPELIQPRSRQRRLNIWCAACSSGQEPYSLAMILRDHFPELATWQVRILASDLSTEMLERARKATYSQFEVNRGVPASLLVRYFQRHGLEWSLIDAIRQMVDFQAINLVDEWPPMAAMDLVLIRNVLIYFDAGAKRQVLSRIAAILARDGYLMLGGSETTFFGNDVFERIDLDRCGAYRLKRGGPNGAGNGRIAGGPA
jgi:chemotaxis protein methyltransferase CheR